MQLYNATEATNAILTFDIFKMLGLADLDQQAKDEYLKKFTNLVTEYYLQEKVGDRLTSQQVEELMTKYPPTNEKNIEAFMQEVGKILPEAGDLFMEALVETKAKLVQDHYERQMATYNELYGKEADEAKREILKTMLDKCELNLKMMDENKWETIEWLQFNID